MNTTWSSVEPTLDYKALPSRVRTGKSGGTRKLFGIPQRLAVGRDHIPYLSDRGSSTRLASQYRDTRRKRRNFRALTPRVRLTRQNRHQFFAKHESPGLARAAVAARRAAPSAPPLL